MVFVFIIPNNFYQRYNNDKNQYPPPPPQTSVQDVAAAERAAAAGPPWPIWDLQGQRLDVGVQEASQPGHEDIVHNKNPKSTLKQKVSTEVAPPPLPPPPSKRIRKPTNKEDKLTRLVTADAEKKFLKHKAKSKRK